MSEAIALEATLLVAATLTVVHLAAPRFAHILGKNRDLVGTIGSGLAVGYVFLHLLSELDEGHAVIGERIHFVVLIGFLIYFGMEHGFAARETEQAGDNSGAFKAALTMKWTYSWLFIYVLPESVQSQSWYILPVTAAILFHVLHGDLELYERFSQRYRKNGARYVLASAPIVGWITDLYFFANNPLVSDVLTACLAGSVLYTTFRSELVPRRTRYCWFLLGVLLFVVLHSLASISGE